MRVPLCADHATQASPASLHLNCESSSSRDYRPYLLRKRTSDKQYQYSRDAAIESAKADLLGRRDFMFEKPDNVKINSGGYRV